MVKQLILWLVRRSHYVRLVGSENKCGTRRYWILWPDEYWVGDVLENARPWYLPFNVFLHCWYRSDEGLMHDHPRWSVTVVLRGKLCEETPRQRRWLVPGSVVVRSHRFIHRLGLPPRYKGKAWTLFIVGRRRWKQHYYVGDQAVPVEYCD